MLLPSRTPLTGTLPPIKKIARVVPSCLPLSSNASAGRVARPAACHIHAKRRYAHMVPTGALRRLKPLVEPKRPRFEPKSRFRSLWVDGMGAARFPMDLEPLENNCEAFFPKEATGEGGTPGGKGENAGKGETPCVCRKSAKHLSANALGPPRGNKQRISNVREIALVAPPLVTSLRDTSHKHTASNY